MLLYYLKLAAKSLVATPGASAVAVLAMALGIAVPTTMISVQHLTAQNPIPEKSDVLYNVRVDSWELDTEFFDVRPGDPPKHITYRDMAVLMASDIPRHRTGIANAVSFVFPENEALRPYQAVLRLCHADFFPMFDVPFRFGSGWSRDADENRERVAVLSHEGNEKLFGGRDSVGDQVRLGEHDYTVVGVLAPWRPTPQFYDVINNTFGSPREVFLPFDLARDQALALTRVGDTDGFGDFDRDDPDAFFTASEVHWVQYWVELEPGQRDAYQSFLDSYATEQKALGRFPRPLNNQITPLMEWMAIREVSPPAIQAITIIALLFLAVCCINLVGLLLGKFLARSGELGVHRALGASKRSIFLRRLVECELVGLLGGVLALALAGLFLHLIDQSLPQQFVSPGLVRLDGFSLVAALGLAVLAGLLSGLYPAWRACRIAPAIQLKLQ